MKIAAPFASCVLALALALASASCTQAKPPKLPAGAEGVSLRGDILFPPPLEPAEKAKREDLLAQARAKLEADPADVDLALWYGRRLAYLGRFNEAIAAFTKGLELHPGDPRLYRQRGHRFITLREFRPAIRDLSRAAELAASTPDEVEPAGLPNSRGIDLSTRNQEIFYHLALAHYLAGEFDLALPAWRECARVSGNPDSQCSATHWLYMTLRRLGREAEAKEAVAPIRADFDIVEYHAYHRLCLAYKGELDPEQLLAEARAKGVASVDFATVGYGAGNWHLYNGREERALEVFSDVLTSPQWHAFGFIASEVELKRRAR